MTSKMAARTAFSRSFKFLGSFLLFYVFIAARVAHGQETADSTTVTDIDVSTDMSISVSIKTETATATAVTTTTASTRVVSIFFIDERAIEGNYYTQRATGSVLSVDDTATTFVITTTRGESVPTWTHLNNSAIATAMPTRSWSPRNATGSASTITQGPGTFVYTGTRWGPRHSVVNRCSLNGTNAAQCNLTQVGAVWYTKDPDWNGTFSTYSYNWTSGDRFGFAPVTITAGAELLGPAVTTTATTNGGPATRPQRSRVVAEETYGLVWTALLMGAAILVTFAVL